MARRSFVVLSLALAGAAAACANGSPTGVNVSVTLEPGTILRPFDHLTIIAEGGGKRGVACFYAPTQNLSPTVGAGSTADPCADNPFLKKGATPTADSWKLGEAPRVANFDFKEGDTVSITALARFGGREVARAATTATAGTPFRETIMALEPEGEACTVALEGQVVATMQEQFECDDRVSPTTTCIAPQATGNLRTSAVTCVADGGGASLNTDEACGEMPIVYSTQIRGASKATECLSGYFDVQFTRCLDGGTDIASCPKTTDCEIPATTLDIIPATVAGTPTHLALGCLPATTYPLTVGPIELPRNFTFQISQAKATARGCTFVVWSLSYVISKNGLECQ
jgi:hypothetical protein